MPSWRPNRRRGQAPARLVREPRPAAVATIDRDRDRDLGSDPNALACAIHRAAVTG